MEMYDLPCPCGEHSVVECDTDCSKDESLSSGTSLREKASWLHTTMDVYASEHYAEFGYDTCDAETKILILESIIEDGLITLSD